MPRLMARGRSTYLLLSGIRVARPVKLAPGLELLPIDPGASPRPYLSGLELVDQQFALLALPWVQAQLKVTATGGAKIGIRAWNALWDVLLLSAIYAVPVNCGLQSTTAFERFTEKSRLNVIHYRVFDPPDGDGYELGESDCSWLERNFSRAQELLDDHRFQTAVHCIATYHWHTLPRAQLALLWAGIEGLFSVDSEISFRVSLYAARFLAAGDELEQRAVFDAVRSLYGIRSKAVHGGKMKGSPRQSVSDSVALLGRLLRACIEKNKLPVLDELAP